MTCQLDQVWRSSAQYFAYNEPCNQEEKIGNATINCEGPGRGGRVEGSRGSEREEEAGSEPFGARGGRVGGGLAEEVARRSP